MIDDHEGEGLRPGQAVGGERFVLGGVLGRGGLALVFEAYDRRRDRVVALKILRMRYVGRREREERLQREFEYARRVSHPTLVEVYDRGWLEGGRPFFSMERVQGRPLSQLISNDGRLAIDQMLRIARRLAMALGALHEQGIVHRDVKPANVLVVDDDRIKLLDLGMAGDQNAPSVPIGHGARLTRVHDLLGTHEYMAPEQVSKAPAHRAMDVFAFGVVMYEMLAGITPYSGMGVREYVRLQLEGDPHARSAQRWVQLRGAPPELSRIVDQCRLRDPMQRPESMQEIVRRLDTIETRVSALRLPVLASSRAMAIDLQRPQVGPVVVPGFRSASPLDRIAGVPGNRPGKRSWPWILPSSLVAAPLGAVLVWLLVGSSPSSESVDQGRVAVLWAADPAPVVEAAGPSPVVEAAGTAPVVEAAGTASVLWATDPAPVVEVAGTAPVLEGAGTAPLRSTELAATVVSPVLTVGAADDVESATSTASSVERPSIEPPGAASPVAGVTVTPNPADPPVENPCISVRRRARAAARKRDWSAVVDLASHTECWAEPVERLRLLVGALAQLKRWPACIEAGRGSTDRIVAEWVALCQHYIRTAPDQP